MEFVIPSVSEFIYTGKHLVRRGEIPTDYSYEELLIDMEDFDELTI